MFSELALITGVVGFFIASYTDIKKHEVSEKLVYSMIVIGIFLHLFESISTQDYSLFTHALTVAFICFAFSFFLYKIGVWASGDVFMFTALGATIPSFRTIIFFPFYSLAVALLLVFPFTIAYTMIGVFKEKKLRKEFFEKFQKKELIVSVVVLFVFGLVKSSFAEALLVFLSIVIFSVFITSFKIARGKVFVEKKRVSELFEGDIPAKTVVIIKGRARLVKPSPLRHYDGRVLVDALNSDGLTKQQIRELKKIGVKHLEVKKTVPFVPIFTAGIVTTILLQMLLNA